jgi:hypothetical protein
MHELVGSFVRRTRTIAVTNYLRGERSFDDFQSYAFQLSNAVQVFLTKKDIGRCRGGENAHDISLFQGQGFDERQSHGFLCRDTIAVKREGGFRRASMLLVWVRVFEVGGVFLIRSFWVSK